jgi:hypothetical protein
MTPQQQKEQISVGYVHVVAARNRFKLGHWTVDDGCLDVTIGTDGTLGGGELSAPKLDLQLKATSDPSVVHDGFIAWELDVDHYDKLRARASTPKLLVVLVLPPDEGRWVEHSIDALVLRRCAYWEKMTGKPPAAPGQRSITVRLPLTNVFSPEALRTLMERLSRAEVL